MHPSTSSFLFYFAHYYVITLLLKYYKLSSPVLHALLRFILIVALSPSLITFHCSNPMRLSLLCIYSVYLFMFSVVCLVLGSSKYFLSDCDSPFCSSTVFPNCLKRYCKVTQQSYSHKELITSSIIQPIEINCYDAVQIFFLSFGVFFLLWFSLLNISSQVNFVNFDTDLNLYKKKTSFSVSIEHILSVLCLLILLCFLNQCDSEQLFIMILWIYPNSFVRLFISVIMKIKLSPIATSFSLLLCIFSISYTPLACILCLLILQTWCYSYARRVFHWLPIFLILISNDIELNPGPRYQKNLFNFMTWNLNSLAKDNFQRLNLIEAHNNIFNYDLICICETSLNDSVELPEKLLDEYTFISANNPANTRHGGVGLFYKNTLNVTVRNDLSFDETIVIELKFGHKKVFFTVIYRSPSFSHLSNEFQTFLLNFERLQKSIKAENPFAMFFTGDYNAHCKFWWPDGDTNQEGSQIDDLFTSLGLSQVISEPTNFEPHKKASCYKSCYNNYN